MYKGDGSYKITTTNEFGMETSFLDLIRKENDMVSSYNIALAAYDTAKKNGMNSIKQKNDLKRSRLEVDKARNELKRFMQQTLGVNVNPDSNITM
jgi:hypothetical protein